MVIWDWKDDAMTFIADMRTALDLKGWSLGRVHEQGLTSPQQAIADYSMSVIGLMVLLWAAVVAINLFTPPEYEVFALYSLVVVFASWYAGLNWGASIAALSMATIVRLGILRGQSNISLDYFELNIITKSIAMLALVIFVNKIKKSYQSALESARTDPLTKLSNRKALQERMGVELTRFHRSGAPFVFAYFDLDGFKRVNDQFGHAIGDQVLITVARIMLKFLRPSDMAVRLGGDEFCILMTDTTYDGGVRVIQRLRAGLLAEMKKHAWPVTFSIGMVTSALAHSSIADIIDQADQLMLKAKRSGKDKVVEQHRGQHEQRAAQWPNNRQPSLKRKSGAG